MDHDMIVLSGGSSVGVRDYTIQVLAGLPESELLVHGVAIRPGKPTILGRTGKVLFWGLPGQPVSALITCRAFLLPSCERLQGMMETERVQRNKSDPRPATPFGARQDRLCSGYPVPWKRGRTEASPIFGKSGAISILARADGFVVIPQHVEGLDCGSEVFVFLF